MNQHHPSDDKIFDRASQLSGEARATYLTAATAGDEQLRQRIEELLRAQDHAGTSFMGQPAMAPTGTVGVTSGMIPVTEKPGDKIGRYKLREQIGEGGCGVVYVAEQEEPVRRRVALKVIKLGMDTRQVVARFEAERQALALMDHPNIAKVLDAGATDTGRPYFVMELVRGIKITDYCDKNNLSTEERLKLFIQVCSAIQHAHQKGIIHRDIKPSNILVTLHDGVPVPKVIDFGIAKATADLKLTDKTIYTAIQQFIGTPAYMSPEQAEMSGLDIDTRSDIYSLGVLLYELLAGSPPFDPMELIKAGFDAMRRTIREVEPPRPSTRLSTLARGDLTTVASYRRAEAARLIKSLRGDLDWIVMKALEKNRVRRYDNVAGFAQDVRHFLSNEAVFARPPSRLYHFQKMVWRNKAAVTVIVAIVIGLVVSMYLLIRALSAEYAQHQSQEEAEQAHIVLAKQAAKEGEARGQARQRQLLEESRATRLTDRSAGWSVQAWGSTSNAAKIQTSMNSSDVRNHAAAALAGLDAQRLQHFTEFGGSSVLFDPEGRQLLVGSLGDGAKLWDGTTNIPVASAKSEPSPLAFVGGKTPAQLLCDLAGQRFLLTSLANALLIREWQIPKQLAARIKAATPPKLSKISAEGSVAVTVLELSDGKEAIVVFRPDSVLILRESATVVGSMAISSDGSLLATSDPTGPVEVWSLENGKRVAAFSSSRNKVLCLALKSVPRTIEASWRGEATNTLWLLAAGDSGGDVTIYDVRSSAIYTQCRGGHYQIYSVAFSRDGTLLASGGRGPVKLWDVANGKLLLDIPTGDYITDLNFSPDGLRLAVSSEGIVAPKNVSVWGLDYGRGIQSLRGLSGQISKFCFSADGRRVAALSHKWEIGVWDVASGQLLRVIEAPEGEFADNAAIALDSSGEQLAFSACKNARLWNIATGIELNTWDLPEGLVDVMAFTGRNHLLLFRLDSWKEAGRVCRIRDLMNQNASQTLVEIRDFNRGVFAAAVSPDGRCFVVEGLGGNGNERRRMVKAYDGLTGKELWNVASTRTAAWAVLMPDAAGKFIAMQTNETSVATMLEMTTGVVVRGLPWLPCGFCVETGLAVAPGHDRGCSLFFGRTESPAVTLGIDQPIVNSAKLEPTGNLLAWGNNDGTVTLCNLKEIIKRLTSANLQW